MTTIMNESQNPTSLPSLKEALQLVTDLSKKLKEQDEKHEELKKAKETMMEEINALGIKIRPPQGPMPTVHEAIVREVEILLNDDVSLWGVVCEKMNSQLPPALESLRVDLDACVSNVTSLANSLSESEKLQAELVKSLLFVQDDVLAKADISEKEVDRLKARLSVANEDIAARRVERDNAYNQVHSLKNDVQRHQGQVQATREELEPLFQRVEALEESREQLNAEEKELESASLLNFINAELKNDELQRQIDQIPQLEEKINNLEAKLKETQRDEDQKRRVESLKITDLQQKNARVTAGKRRVEAYLEGVLEDQSSKIRGLQSDLSESRMVVAGLREKLTQSQSSVDDLRLFIGTFMGIDSDTVAELNLESVYDAYSKLNGFSSQSWAPISWLESVCGLSRSYNVNASQLLRAYSEEIAFSLDFVHGVVLSLVKGEKNAGKIVVSVLFAYVERRISNLGVLSYDSALVLMRLFELIFGYVEGLTISTTLFNLYQIFVAKFDESEFNSILLLGMKNWMSDNFSGETSSLGDFIRIAGKDMSVSCNDTLLVVDGKFLLVYGNDKRVTFVAPERYSFGFGHTAGDLVLRVDSPELQQCFTWNLHTTPEFLPVVDRLFGSAFDREIKDVSSKVYVDK